MIPKLIHYCWFGPNKKSDLNLTCMESWKKHLPDFEIKEWNETNFPIDDYPFAKVAYSQRKYAFVADVARLYALQSEGGIYFDTDVEILKPLYHLLNDTAFMGFETEKMVGVGVIGSIPNGEVISVILNYYKRLPFSTIVQPLIVTSILDRMGFDMNGESQTAEDFLTIYSEDYFTPYNYYTKKTCLTSNSVALHHYEGSWLEKEKRNCYKSGDVLY